MAQNFVRLEQPSFLLIGELQRWGLHSSYWWAPARRDWKPLWTKNLL